MGFREQLDLITLAAVVRKRDAMRELDDDELLEASEPRPAPIGPGDLVRFTGTVLQQMYSVSGNGMCKAPDRRWTVVACECGLCASGRFVAVDELDTYGDGQRHMALAGVERCPFARTEPSAAESAGLRAALWEQCGVDVEAGICRRPMP